MKNIRCLFSLMLLAATLLFGGCATMSSHVTPGTDLARVKKIYVVHLPPDERKVNQIITDRLNQLGYQATTGEAADAPTDIDATLTYQDKWMWDITMYMIELNVQLREPKTDFALATARTFRPSLQRKSPAGMVEEVLSQLFPTK